MNALVSAVRTASYAVNSPFLHEGYPNDPSQSRFGEGIEKMVLTNSTAWFIASIVLLLGAVAVAIWQQRRIKLRCRAYLAGRSSGSPGSSDHAETLSYLSVTLTNTGTSKLRRSDFEESITIDFGQAVVAKTNKADELAATDFDILPLRHSLQITPFDLAPKESIQIVVALQNYTNSKPTVTHRIRRLAHLDVLLNEEEFQWEPWQAVPETFGTLILFMMILLGLIQASNVGGVLGVVLGTLTAMFGIIAYSFMSNMNVSNRNWLLRILPWQIGAGATMYFFLFGAAKFDPLKAYDPYMGIVMGVISMIGFLTVLLTSVIAYFARKRQRATVEMLAPESASLVPTIQGSTPRGVAFKSRTISVPAGSFACGAVTFVGTGYMPGGINGRLGFALGSLGGFVALYMLAGFLAARRRRNANGSRRMVG